MSTEENGRPIGGDTANGAQMESGSMLVRVLVVEDDKNEAAKLLSCLKRYEELHNQPFVISVIDTAFDLVDTVPDADILFMDIGLPGINGMEAAGMLRMKGVRTPIIFITSLAQYAASSYEVDALDFMVKPVKYESFALRMDRALRVIHRTLGRSILIKTKEGLRVIPITDVTAITVDGHTVNYHQIDGTEFVARGSMGKVAQELEGTPFVRVTSGVLVNMDYVRSVDTWGVKLSTGEEYPISRPKRKEVLRIIANYFGGSDRS